MTWRAGGDWARDMGGFCAPDEHYIPTLLTLAGRAHELEVRPENILPATSSRRDFEPSCLLAPNKGQ